MGLQEILIRERKARGLSQEELASRIGVSRQAVSKWETGDALPDLPKLLALADALAMSLDALCGRETDAGNAAPPDPSGESAPPPAVGNRGNRVRIWQALCGVLTLCLLAGGIRAWSRRDIVPAESAAAASSMPETFAVTAGNFCGDGPSRLTYRFVPGIAGDAYAYQITFAGSFGEPVTFDAPYSGGVCTDTVYLDPSYGGYLVTVLVSDGMSSRAALLADDLTFDDTSAHWTPAE